MKKLLIITSKADYHADHLIHRINQIGFGHTVVRLNTEDFNNNVRITYLIDKISFDIKDANKSFTSKDIFCVWYRRPDKIIINEADKDTNSFIYSQSDELLKSIYYYLLPNIKWINNYDKLQNARIKIDQLRIAKELNFNVPNTIISNNFDEIINFTTQNKLISHKSINTPNFKIDGRLHSYFNRKVSINEIKENKKSIEICPTLFQQYIEKKSDIRVVCIGRKIIAIEITSQDNNLSIEDFRGASPYLLKHKLHKLPIEIQNKIRKYLNYYKLNFSAIDLLLDTKGEYYFLENNPNGQWLWLEHTADIDLTKHFIKEFYRETEYFEDIVKKLKNTPKQLPTTSVLQ